MNAPLPTSHLLKPLSAAPKSNGRRVLRVIPGDSFGRLTALRVEGLDAQGREMIACRCECGSEKLVMMYSLTSGAVKSCGCLQRDTVRSMCTTHGKHGTREHNIWQLMHQRCRNPSASHYASYGGRGIAICQEWESFERFLSDMGPCPPKHSIDRIDNDKGYSKENCRWATHGEQMRNTSRTVNVTLDIDGVNTTMCLKDWSERLGVPYPTVRKRIRMGMTPEAALKKGPYRP